jgi:HD-GYP domain-containing protein (c-di-GMP phosphodiesterase class II)
MHKSPEDVRLIEKLLDIAIALASSNNLGDLLNLILSKSREITCSDAGSIYLLDRSESQPMLLFKAAQNASRPFVSLREFAMPLTDESLAGYVALTGESLNIPDAYYLPPETPYQLNRNFDQDIGYHTRSVLAMPMRNRKGEVIGILQLLNRKTKPEELLNPSNVHEITQPFSESEERIMRLLASQAGISIERNQLHENIEYFLEEFVKAAVRAIEMRDPRTAGHADRVSQLTLHLGKAVNAVSTGELGRVHFDEKQLQELRYAALLHDFGEVGVPEAILTKAKKLSPQVLETIRTRFDLARRTWELEALTAQLQPSSIASSYLTDEIAQLETDWQCVLKANEPDVLSAEALAQLQAVAARTYRAIDGQMQPLLTLSELAHLSVIQGTLTEQERSVMQSHVIRSYEFLQCIPWPKEFAQVPKIVYAHHERPDGSGYPQGLKGDRIPLTAQILTLADVYDALTAGDRPHKPGIPPQQALEILREDARHDRLHRELVALFEEQHIFTILGHTIE